MQRVLKNKEASFKYTVKFAETILFWKIDMELEWKLNCDV